MVNFHTHTYSLLNNYNHTVYICKYYVHMSFYFLPFYYYYYLFFLLLLLFIVT